MIVLVTGSRDHGDHHQVWRELDMVRTVENFALVVGDCPTGADLYAREWAVANEAFYAEAPTGVRADWATHRSGGGAAAQPSHGGPLPADSVSGVLLAGVGLSWHDGLCELRRVARRQDRPDQLARTTLTTPERGL